MITRYTAVTLSYHLCGWDTMEIWFTPMKFGAVNGTQFRLPKMPSKLLFTKNCPNIVYHGLLILMIKVVHFFAIVMQEHLIPCWYPAEEFNELFAGSVHFVMTSVRVKMLGTNPRNGFIQSCVVSMFPKVGTVPNIWTAPNREQRISYRPQRLIGWWFQVLLSFHRIIPFDFHIGATNRNQPDIKKPSCWVLFFTMQLGLFGRK